MAGKFVYRFARQGVSLHLEDAMIGASAICEHLILVTRNVSHFPMLSLDRDLIRFPND
jgi:predicted nucleic acid-binding protein